MKPPETTEITVLRRTAKQQHRRANWTFLGAGLWLGTAAYLARTRMSQLVEGGRFAQWAVVVLVGIVLFALGARLHKKALEAEDRIRSLEDE